MEKIRAGRALYLLVIILSVAFLWIGNNIATKDLKIFEEGSDQEIVKAVVLEIINRDVEQYSFDDITTFESKSIDFKAKILRGENKGVTVSARQELDSSMPFGGTVEINKGDKILLANSDIEGIEWYFAEFVRTDKLIIFGILFIIALLIFGRRKGLNTVLSLSFTCLAIFTVFVPAILSGKNIYFWSILICLYTIVMTLLIVYGFNKKTLAAAIGCFGGIVISGILTVITSKVLALTGILDEESIYLTLIPMTNPIDLNAIIFAAIVIGAMGAIMDIAISIASSLWEVKKANTLSFEEIFKSGINIGRDIMGTMTNTLILAYIGGSMSIVLLFTVYSPSILYTLNREMIVVEILQALVGSFGILFTLPLTSLVCAKLYTKKQIRRVPY